MERRRRLADLLAVAAGELLPDMLDHLPLPRDHLQRLGDVLAQLAQPRAAAARASGRRRLDHPLARQMLGEGLARRALAGEGRRHWWSWPTACSAAISSSVAELSSSSRPAPSGRAAAPCAPSAGRRARASAWRSADADGRSGPDRRRPWPWPPPARPRPGARRLGAARRVSAASQRGDVVGKILGRRVHGPE